MLRSLLRDTELSVNVNLAAPVSSRASTDVPKIPNSSSGCRGSTMDLTERHELSGELDVLLLAICTNPIDKWLLR
jgi:hypothetical protein